MDDLFRIKLHFSYSFSTGPKRQGGDMENLNFENFFGSSVAIHKKEQSVVLTASSQKAKAMSMGNQLWVRIVSFSCVSFIHCFVQGANQH